MITINQEKFDTIFKEKLIKGVFIILCFKFLWIFQIEM